MERNNNNLRNELTDHSLKSKSYTNNYYFNNPSYNVEDYSNRFSRSYICTFCKREFKSAQALGGHMNVHRRDRARLRCQSPPSRGINLNTIPNPSPSPNPNPSIATTCTLPSNYSSHREMKKFRVTEGAPHTNLSQLSAGSDSGKAKAVKSLFGVKEFVGLELGIGLDSEHFMKEDHVDLELRLGYS